MGEIVLRASCFVPSCGWGRARKERNMKKLLFIAAAAAGMAAVADVESANVVG